MITPSNISVSDVLSRCHRIGDDGKRTKLVGQRLKSTKHGTKVDTANVEHDYVKVLTN